MLKLNFYTFGDAEKHKTWSNVPYFLSKAMENKGIIIDHVNLQANSAKPYLIFEFLFWRYIKLIKKCFSKKETLACYDFTLLNDCRLKKIISKTANNNNQIDFFLSFSFGWRMNKENKLVLLHDWNKEWEIENIHKRKPDFFEKRFIYKERKVLHSADKIICLFPGFVQYLKKIGISESKVLYLGPHVNIPLNKTNVSVNINNKLKRLKILFIGNRKFYSSGLSLLLEATNFLLDLNPEIWIIGFSKNEVNPEYKNIKCWKYLDKDILEERDTFYKLLSEATLFVNTNPEWGGFSSCVEAMYFYTPVILSKYQEFLNVFGENINFGRLLSTSNPNEIAKCIRIVYNDKENYNCMAEAAHLTVRDFTWTKHAENIIDFINN